MTETDDAFTAREADEAESDRLSGICRREAQRLMLRVDCDQCRAVLERVYDGHDITGIGWWLLLSAARDRHVCDQGTYTVTSIGGEATPWELTRDEKGAK